MIEKYYPDLKYNEDGLVQVYSSAKDEYSLIRYGAGIRNISKFNTYRLNGKDTVDFVGRLSTNEVSGVADGTTVNTIFANVKGRVIDRAKFLKAGNDYYLFSARRDNALQFWLEKYIISEDINIEDISDTFGKFKLLGAHAESFLIYLIGGEAEKLERGQSVSANINGAEVILIKDSYEANLSAFYLVFNFDYLELLLRALLDKENIFDVGFVGEEAYKSFRIEVGRPAAPNEINDKYNPHELNLTSEISFSKGCYIGQEVLARLETYDKIQRKLVGVVFSNSHLPKQNSAVKREDGTEIGEITSCAESFLTGKNIGLAVLRNKFTESGMSLTAEDGSKFTVESLPFKF